MARSRDEPVRLTRIYTRAGDAGETSLGSGSRVPKTDPRIEAYGTVDSSTHSSGSSSPASSPRRSGPGSEEVQNDLFDVGADLSVPLADERRSRLRVTPGQVERLEQLCDLVNERLEPLRSFVLPGGTEAGARLHVARAVCRRAERRGAALAAAQDANPVALAYLNRLSDLLLHPCPGRERRLSGAVVEAWELALASVGSFVAGFLGSMVGLVLGSLRLPAVLLASGSTAAAAGTNIAVSASPRSPAASRTPAPAG